MEIQVPCTVRCTKSWPDRGSPVFEEGKTYGIRFEPGEKVAVDREGGGVIPVPREQFDTHFVIVMRAECSYELKVGNVTFRQNAYYYVTAVKDGERTIFTGNGSEEVTITNKTFSNHFREES